MKTIPIFPLSIVVFPGETTQLHIFEPRYKQLVHECDENDLTFGIVALVEEKIAIYGTEVRVKKTKRMYADGRMDIEVQGLRVFRLENYLQHYPDRMYPGAKVEFLENYSGGIPETGTEIKGLYEKISELLRLRSGDVMLPEREPDLSTGDLSFHIGHHIGFTLKQKIKLLSIEKEVGRQSMILGYFQQVLPLLESVMEKMEGESEDSQATETEI